MHFYSYCYPGLETICCGFCALEQVGEICLCGAISMKEGEGLAGWRVVRGLIRDQTTGVQRSQSVVS